MKAVKHSIGIDIGSTTAKYVVYGQDAIIASDYLRHHGQIRPTLEKFIIDLENQGIISLSVKITGSAGMGLSERLDIPFIQELEASTAYIEQMYPSVEALIDIGGEDSKIIIFGENGVDLRMNSSCAGGTGAFIDQMASIMNLTAQGLDKIAETGRNVFNIASRCGVFAKTDVQNLISRKIPTSDIAASIFISLGQQIKNTLLRGTKIRSKIAFAGGPLTYLKNLRTALIEVFGLNKDNIIDVPFPALVPAYGAAISNGSDRMDITTKDFLKLFKDNSHNILKKQTLMPLFDSDNELEKWIINKKSKKVARTSLREIDGKPCYLGIDSGSTTTKIVLIDDKSRLAFEYYTKNAGNPIAAVSEGLENLNEELQTNNSRPLILSSAVCGYGESLIKAAFGINYGAVETMAHFTGAKQFNPNVSFILDIGGQDIKAIFIDDGVIRNIEINEACSSGCGSFIETFAHSLNYSVTKFAELACKSNTPCDLGTRCTVFMNSKVKQSFREGMGKEDISAGLAYSVVQNCLHKVLRIHDFSSLGDNVVVQGGAFKNPAIHKAFEKISGLKAISPDISELMGAYGVAIIAKNKNKNNEHIYIHDLLKQLDIKEKFINCKGCENNCEIKILRFSEGRKYFTGNRCEKYFNNSEIDDNKGFNGVSYKYDLIFNRLCKPTTDTIAKLGIPRVLNLFENYPFWNELFRACGIEVVLSDESSEKLSLKGTGTVMSDNICYPAKLAHGHIIDLIEKGVDRIFYPMVVFEKNELEGANNSYNCPIVTGYPNLIENSINQLEEKRIQLDTPAFTFKNRNLLKKACYKYLKEFGINHRLFNKAFKVALKAQADYRKALRKRANEVIEKSHNNNKSFVLLAMRPYHIDRQIHHGLPEIIAEYGLDVITEDSIEFEKENLADVQILTQWNYTNRILAAAKWSARQNNVEFMQANSFGCGPDTVLIDEAREIIESAGKIHTLIRIDEHTTAGSMRLRIRSLAESLKLKNNPGNVTEKERYITKPFETEDSRRRILVPFFSPFHSGYVAAPFAEMGYHVEVLPPSSDASINNGLKYVNNEICYPATLIIGDVITALESGRYDIKDTAIGLSQTGGQCRASNYPALLKKAMVKAGFKDVPVVGVSLIDNLNYQPGFKLNKMDIVTKGLKGLLFGDIISNMYHCIAPREKNKGEAKLLSEKYAKLAFHPIGKGNTRELTELLTEATKEFNSIALKSEKAQPVGVVGEIYVKYNPVANLNVVNWLINHGVEPKLPPLVNMFLQWFVNVNIKHEHRTESNFIPRTSAKILEFYKDNVIKKFVNSYKDFRFYEPIHSIHEIADAASQSTNMINHYFGEGWLIPGDVALFARNGINRVLCLQPFGCIANHIIARGIENRIKNIYSHLRIQYLDIDSGACQANIHNRLHLLLK